MVKIRRFKQDSSHPIKKTVKGERSTTVSACYGETESKGGYEFSKPQLCQHVQFDRILSKAESEVIHEELLESLKTSLKKASRRN